MGVKGTSEEDADVKLEKLKNIATTHQVLCISHLAPIAAVADYHYFIRLFTA